MRKRFAIVLAAGARWPDAKGDLIGACFNWLKVDNRGSGKVDVGLSPLQIQGDLVASYATVGNAKTRVFNLAGPAREEGSETGEDWPDQVYLIADSTGTTVILEVADHPIVDLSQAT